ncbi:MAG: signal peptidase I [Candidatus Omnitrophica bacterium]|nr:signal peptidase I [Candidatus Omnitrophota bacterium]
MRKSVVRFYLQTKGGIVTISGKSMFPAIKKGWKVKIAPISPEQIKIGDIIDFGIANFCIHRVIGRFRRKGKLFFIEKGDNVNFARVISAEEVIGKVVEVYNENSERVDSFYWGKALSIPADFSFLTWFIYRILYFIKRVLFKQRKNRLFSILGQFYWRSFFTLLMLNSKLKR